MSVSEKNYKGKVWDYWEYDKYLKHQKIKHKYKKECYQ